MGILCKTLGYVVDFKCKTWQKWEVLANDKEEGKKDNRKLTGKPDVKV